MGQIDRFLVTVQSTPEILFGTYCFMRDAA